MIGSAIAAAGGPALCWSTSSKPTSRQVEVAGVGAVADRAAIGVGRRDREVAGHARAVAAAADRVGRGPGAAGQAVERGAEPDHLVAAGRELGHAQRRLVGFAAGVEQDHLLQLRRQQGCQLAAELDHLRRQQPAEQMDRPLAAAADRGDHGGMVVAERRAHLARREVEDPPAAVVVDIGPLRTLDEERRKVADVADHVALDGVLKLAPALPPVAALRPARVILLPWSALCRNHGHARAPATGVNARQRANAPSVE